MATLFEQLEEQPILFLKRLGFPIGRNDDFLTDSREWLRQAHCAGSLLSHAQATPIGPLPNPTTKTTCLHRRTGHNCTNLLTERSQSRDRAVELLSRRTIKRIHSAKSTVMAFRHDLFPDPAVSSRRRPSCSVIFRHARSATSVGLAYVLLCALRRIGLEQTHFANATCGSIRLKLLKIGALVQFSVRRIKVGMASACPAADVWGQAAGRLAAARARGSPA
jgi:hypothetical protein